MKRQSKKEKEVIDKCKRDMEGMASNQKMEYLRLNDTEKAKFVQKFREECGIRHIAQENHIEDSKSTKSKTTNDLKSSKLSTSSKFLLTKKEREKGFRAERIWIKGN